MGKIIDFDKVLERKREEELEKMDYEAYKNQNCFLGMDETLIRHAWSLGLGLKKENTKKDLD